ncbi:MAG TPA: NAD(P)H-binding protein [Blastocatellia bacterium]|nr:NAD(P)H-binding protein [Blastocatellia bacterium]
MSRTALILGASGLVGGHCLTQLLADPEYAHVTILVRKPFAPAHLKLTQRVINFDQINEAADAFRVQDVFCCLGTTIKTAESQEAFRRVDFTYPTESARLAQQQGATQFLLVSSLGANAKSRMFYSRTKGEVERAIAASDLTSVQIFRPSLLLGERTEVRPGEQWAEKISRAISFLLVGPLRKYRPIEARAVAAAMIAIAKQQPPGIHIYESDRIAQIAANAGSQ